MDSNNDIPRSGNVLNAQIERLQAQTNSRDKKSVRRALITAVIGQMLPEKAFLKGGSALMLRYPLADARHSRDVDSSFQCSREEFLTELQKNLNNGWNGFTGTVEEEDRRNLPKNVQLTPLIIKLDYKGKRFARVEFEATPDIENHYANARPLIDSSTQSLLAELGFTVDAPNMMSLEDQLADKLNALSNPEKRRGKDIRDIEYILAHNSVDLLKLRAAVRASERVPNGHEVHVMTTDMSEYARAYAEAGGTNLDEAWETVNDLLLQVDCNYAYKWKDSLNDTEPSPNVDYLIEEADREADLTERYLAGIDISQPPVDMTPPPSFRSGRVYVAPYRRADGTIVRSHTRKR